MNNYVSTATRLGDVPFDRSFQGRPGELVRLSPLVRRMVAGNACPMTFAGTCTYVVGKGEVAVADPGPSPHCLRRCVAKQSRQFSLPTRTRIIRQERGY
jgi:hypothetical protein